MANKHTIIDEENVAGVTELLLEFPIDTAQSHVAIDDHNEDNAIFTDLDSDPVTIHIPSIAYFRAMGNLFWSAIRHPLLDTTIDLSTGRTVPIIRVEF